MVVSAPWPGCMGVTHSVSEGCIYVSTLQTLMQTHRLVCPARCCEGKLACSVKATPWVWWVAGMGPLIYTGLTVTGDQREAKAGL